MKKILSFVVILAMVMAFVPAAMADYSGYSIDASYQFGTTMGDTWTPIVFNEYNRANLTIPSPPEDGYLYIKAKDLMDNGVNKPIECIRFQNESGVYDCELNSESIAVLPLSAMNYTREGSLQACIDIVADVMWDYVIYINELDNPFDFSPYVGTYDVNGVEVTIDADGYAVIDGLVPSTSYKIEPQYTVDADGNITHNLLKIYAYQVNILFTPTFDGSGKLTGLAYHSVSSQPSTAKYLPAEWRTNQTEVKANVNPSYIVVIPAMVDFGTQSPSATSSVAKQDFYVDAQEMYLEDGAKVEVKVTSPFVMKDKNGLGNIELPYKLYCRNEAQPSKYQVDSYFEVLTDELFCDFVENRIEEGKIEMDRMNITKAGVYSGTMTFTLSYIAPPVVP